MVGSKAIFERSMQRGQEYAAENEWTKALAEYERALSQVPNDVGARGNLALAMFQLGRWPDAIREYEQLARFLPNNITILDHLVAAYVNTGDRDHAEKLYLELAQLYIENHRLPAAIETLERLVQLAPGNAEAYERLASLYEQKGDPARAAQCCLSLGRLHASAGRLVEATKYAERALALDGKNADSVLLLTEMSKRREADDKAVKSQAWPDEPSQTTRQEQFNRLMKSAESLTVQGRYNDAIEKYQDLLNAGMDEPRVRYPMALLFQQSNQIEKAIGQYALITGDNEYGISAFYGLGECYESLGQYQPAGEYYERAIALIDVKSLRRAEIDELVQMYDKATEVYVRLGDCGRAAALYDTLSATLQSRGGVAERAEQIRQKAVMLAEQSMLHRLRRLDSSNKACNAQRGSQPLSKASQSVRELRLDGIGEKVTGPLRPITYFLPPIEFSESEVSAAAGPHEVNCPEPDVLAQIEDRVPLAIDAVGTAVEPTLEYVEQSPSVVATLAPDELEWARQQAGIFPDSEPQIEVLPACEAETYAAVDSTLLASAVGQLVREGDDYRKNGLFAAATDKYLEALNREPSCLALHFRLSDVYLSQGRVTEALEKLEILASLLDLRGDLAELVTAYRRILLIQPKNTSLREKLAAILRERGEFGEATSETIALVETLLASDQHRKAMEISQELAESLPDTARERLAYGRLLTKVGDYPGAIPHFERALELGCHTVSAETGIAICLIMTGDETGRWIRIVESLCTKVRRNPAEAAQITADLTQVIPRQPWPQLTYSLGKVYSILDRNAEANIQFSSAVDHLPSGSPLFQFLVRSAFAQSLIAQQQTDAAIPQLIESIRLVPETASMSEESPVEDMPDPVSLHERLADCYLHQGDAPKAIESLQQAKTIAPDRQELLERLASLYIGTGELDLARCELSALADMQERSGKVAQACETIVQLAEIDPSGRDEARRIMGLCKRSSSTSAAEYLARLGDAYVQSQRTADAIQTYYEAARLFWQMKAIQKAFEILESAVDRITEPDNAALRHQLINLYLYTKDKTKALDHLKVAAGTAIRAGRVKRAIMYLQRILSIAPSDIQAHYQLAAILGKLSEYEQALVLYSRLIKLQPSNLKLVAVYNQVAQLAAKKRRQAQVDSDAAGGTKDVEG